MWGLTTYRDMTDFSWSMGAVVRNESSTLRHFSCSDGGYDCDSNHSRVESDRHNNRGNLENIAEKFGEETGSSHNDFWQC